MSTASPDPAARPAKRGALPRGSLVLGALLGAAVLVYLVSALLPLARPQGLYAGMGAMMMLPILLLCAALAAFVGGAVVAAVAWWAGLRRSGLILVVLVAAFICAASFFAGFDSPLFDPLAISRHELTAMEAEREAMSAHRERLQPAIEQGNLPAMQAALSTDDPTLTPAQLLCLVRRDVIEGRGGESLPTVSEQRYRFLQDVAVAAWNKADTPQGRRAIGLLAMDASLRHGTTRDVAQWLERGVDPRNPDWARDVSAQTEPAGRCATFVRWPLSTLEHNEHDADGKRDLLFKIGVEAIPAW